MTHSASVRVRASIGATLIIAFALVISAVALHGVLDRALLRGIDSNLELRSDDIVALIEAGTPPVEVAVEDQTDGLVQLVVDGTVIASSDNLVGDVPVTNRPIGSVFTARMNLVDESEDFRLIVASATASDGPVAVIVGKTLEDLDAALLATRNTLLVVVPLLTALVAALTWAVIGGALRPVEEIRAEVADIGATDLHRRVPVPASDDEIGRLARTMNQMLDRIESGTIRQQRFVSDASHELRSPIAVIRHELEVAMQHPEVTDWPAVAADVLDEDLRMQRLVDDLLFLARHDQTPVSIPAALVDLDEIVERIVRHHSARAGVRIDGSGVGAGQVRGNADDLGRAVQNLLGYAIRHATSVVAVSVASTANATVVVHVDDDGDGVDVAARDLVFERFSRSDQARTRDRGGAGLGLSIAVEIVEGHGGSLMITDSPLGGARFTIELTDARADVSLNELPSS